MGLLQKQIAFTYGRDSETAAAGYLAGKGYRVLLRNFRCRRGEIDLIVAKENALVFVEVKARQEGAAIDAVYSLTPEKCRRLQYAAAVFLSRNPESLNEFEEIRFDLLILTACRVSEHLEAVLFCG